MATEFKLSYTANEINEKLSKVDSLVSTVNGISPDINGNVVLPSGGIIDVVELPKTDINESVFYRLMNGTIVCNQEDCTNYGWFCYCVDGLPATGIAATNADISIMNVYYNTQDGLAYGYLDEMLASAFGYPTGWYDFGMLMTLADATYSGTITDIEDDPEDSSVRILLKYDFYVHKNDWTKLVFGYEKTPKFDITWDGDMTGKLSLDMSALGFANTYFVKVSDDVFTTNEVIDCDVKIEYFDDSCSEFNVKEEMLDTATYPGAISINNYIVILYDSDTLATALGIPTGIYTNGIYFWLSTEYGYVSKFIAPSRITKIDKKFIDVPDIDLSNYSTTSQVQTMINTAIGNAIGGSY